MMLTPYEWTRASLLTTTEAVQVALPIDPFGSSFFFPICQNDQNYCCVRLS